MVLCVLATRDDDEDRRPFRPPWNTKGRGFLPPPNVRCCQRLFIAEDRRFFSMRAGIQFKTLQLFLREFPMRLTQDRKLRLCGFLIPNSEERSVLEFNCARVA